MAVYKAVYEGLWMRSRVRNITEGCARTQPSNEIIARFVCTIRLSQCAADQQAARVVQRTLQDSSGRFNRTVVHVSAAAWNAAVMANARSPRAEKLAPGSQNRVRPQEDKRAEQTFNEPFSLLHLAFVSTFRTLLVEKSSCFWKFGCNQATTACLDTVCCCCCCCCSSGSPQTIERERDKTLLVGCRAADLQFALASVCVLCLVGRHLVARKMQQLHETGRFKPRFEHTQRDGQLIASIHRSPDDSTLHQ